MKMKVPNEISTLEELSVWFDNLEFGEDGHPKIESIEIGKNSKLMPILSDSFPFPPTQRKECLWQFYKRIKINYETI